MTDPLAISENQRGELLLTEYVRSISTGEGVSPVRATPQ